MDARRLQAALMHLRLALPHGLLPGSYPGGLVEVAADAETWAAYRWNPPEYMRQGALCRIGPWAALRLVPHPRRAGGLYNEFAYLAADFEAGPPAPPALPAPTGAAALPEGWRALPEAFPAWSVARRVHRVPAALALDERDADAAPKPAWAALVEAERAARLGALPAALIRQANAEAKARIAIAYVGTPDRIEEITWRLNGRATAAQDAERARIVAACHALERRIGKAETIEALEAIDVAGDAAWTATEGGDDGDEG